MGLSGNTAYVSTAHGYDRYNSSDPWVQNLEGEYITTDINYAMLARGIAEVTGDTASEMISYVKRMFSTIIDYFGDEFIPKSSMDRMRDYAWRSLKKDSAGRDWNERLIPDGDVDLTDLANDTAVVVILGVILYFTKGMLPSVLSALSTGYGVVRTRANNDATAEFREEVLSDLGNLDSELDTVGGLRDPELIGAFVQLAKSFANNDSSALYKLINQLE